MYQHIYICLFRQNEKQKVTIWVTYINLINASEINEDTWGVVQPKIILLIHSMLTISWLPAPSRYLLCEHYDNMDCRTTLYVKCSRRL